MQTSILEWSASLVELHGYQNKTLIISKLQSTGHYHHLINPPTRYSATKLLKVLLLTLTTSNRGIEVAKEQYVRCGEGLLFHSTLWWLVLKGSCVSTRISNLTWVSVRKSGSLSGTETYNGTHKISAGAFPYFWVRLLFFAVGVEKLAKTVLLLSG